MDFFNPLQNDAGKDFAGDGQQGHPSPTCCTVTSLHAWAASLEGPSSIPLGSPRLSKSDLAGGEAGQQELPLLLSELLVGRCQFQLPSHSSSF